MYILIITPLNHTSVGILICYSLSSFQTLAKHEKILISAVKQLHSLLLLYIYDNEVAAVKLSARSPFTQFIKRI